MRRRGSSLVEVMIAGALTLLVVGTASQAAWMVRSSFYSHSARMAARQDVRTLTADLGRELRAGGRIFTGFQGTMDGQSYSVPAAGQTGSSLIFAAPENDAATLWTVCGVSCNAQGQVVLYRRRGLATGNPSPATITGGTRKLYDCSVPPGNFKITVGPLADCITLDLWCQRKPIGGLAHLQQHVLNLSLRNGQ